MTKDEIMRMAWECDLGRVCGPLETLLDGEWEDLHRFAEWVISADRRCNNLDATVFVYRHLGTGEVTALYADDARAMGSRQDYAHVATLEPRMWIENHFDDSAQRDELLMALKELLGPYVAKPCEITGMLDLLVCGEDISAARAAIAKAGGVT